MKVLLYFIFTNDDNNENEGMRKWYTDVKRARRDVSKPYNLSFSIAIAWGGRQERTVTC